MKKWLAICVWGCSGFALAHQDPVTIVGTVVQAIQPSIPVQQHRALSARSSVQYLPKPIALLKLKLTPRTKATLARRILTETHSTQSTLSFGYYPRQVQLGMNNVPVLEQGMYGTCTLFAITAGLDAALGKGDYISQLCQLDLSRYLNAHTYSESGWNGGWGDELYEHLMMFGVVPKSMQETGACAGRRAYPIMGEEDIRDELSVFDYHQMSESILAQGISIVPLIHAEQVNSGVFNREQLLYKIKGILHRGDRVTASFLLYNAGAPFGSHHVSNDTWILRPEMAETAQQDEYAMGHTLVITGYDDDAIATDHTGRIHRGLLTLRNSWGSTVGDHGDFYMTYTYFKAAVLEAHQISLNLMSS